MKARPQLAGSCGRPIPGVQCRLRPLPGGAGETGELVIRSAMASDAYLDDKGWCSLGDVMRRDADGYLYFERRLDRMINTGYHVYPDEVEAALGRCHGVEAVLVRGEPHPRWGEMVVAYLVGNETLEPQALIARVRHELERGLARYKVPREFRIVRELPPS
jgi:acyl-CoA synthetase (AMP-forming)/AMP-acid ligase II